MISKLKPAVYLVVAATSALFAMGCAKPNTKQEQEDRLTHLIDAQEYATVVNIFNAEENNEELKPQRPYLAQAYLGLAGFEPIRLAAKVMGEQKNIPSEIDALIPGCSGVALARDENPPARCLTKRLLTHLPKADDPNFQKGREILLEIFQNIETTPRKYNILIAATQAASALSRAGKILLQYNGLNADTAEQKDIQPLFDEIARLGTDADQSLARAKKWPWVVERYLTGLEKAQLSDVGGTSYVPGTGIPQLTALMSEQNQDLKSKLVKIMLLQKIDSIVESLKTDTPVRF